MKRDGFTDRQKRFIDEYVQCLNATKAARAAGYTGASDVIGPRLLGNVRLRAEVDKRLSKRSLTSDEIVLRLTQHATATLEDFFDVSEWSGKNELNLEKAKRAGKLHLVKKFRVKHGRDGTQIEIELHDAQAALDKLARIRGLYKDRIVVDWRVESGLSEDDANSIYRAMVEAARTRLAESGSGGSVAGSTADGGLAAAPRTASGATGDQA